ncbi:hypothetical protein ACLOJK_041538 [Asimina triloba]
MGKTLQNSDFLPLLSLVGFLLLVTLDPKNKMTSRLSPVREEAATMAWLVGIEEDEKRSLFEWPLAAVHAVNKRSSVVDQRSTTMEDSATNNGLLILCRQSCRSGAVIVESFSDRWFTEGGSTSSHVEEDGTPKLVLHRKWVSGNRVAVMSKKKRRKRKQGQARRKRRRKEGERAKDEERAGGEREGGSNSRRGSATTVNKVASRDGYVSVDKCESAAVTSG